MLIICSIWLCNKDCIGINQVHKSGHKSGHSCHYRYETDDIAGLVLALDNLNIVDSLTAEEYINNLVNDIRYMRIIQRLDD